MPQAVRVHTHGGDGARVRPWIPLLPVFVVLSPLLVVALVVLVVACIIVRANPGRALGASWRLGSALRGVRIEVARGRRAVLVTIT